MIKLTDKQVEAIKMAEGLKTFNERPKLAVLAGYAGTGKTTVLKYIAEKIGYPMVITPTGKAAVRAREVTGLAAKTCHSWLYDAVQNNETGMVEWERKPIDKMETGETPVVIIDEASMIDEDLWNDIYDACSVLGLNVYIVGDGFQLPPVKQKKGLIERLPFSLLDESFIYDERVMLTEVMRQALESPIIRASMLIRDGQSTKAVMELPRIQHQKLVDEAADAVNRGGMVICHKNETRQRLNISIRNKLGLPADRIVENEPLLILQNCYGANRYNGEIVRFSRWRDEPGATHAIKDWLRKGPDGKAQVSESRYGVAVLDWDENKQKGTPAIVAVAEVFGQLGHVSLPAIEKTAEILFGRQELDDCGRITGDPMLHCNFGYVSTAHKAQGSEWDHVFVVMESSVRQRELDGQRWFYTAITRAKTTATVCLGVKI